ncbi:DNA methyltransferase 1-associated protein 1-like [Artemia franciscana]|uniref:DNA methyltransferase 1-associated protein 1 n=1 Tax=Artemia franciscana TaxID=6661 RepID=A0AA88IMB8_ARTSF|nr:hypothetical protein QYM36_001040 [Artemia franciscana]
MTDVLDILEIDRPSEEVTKQTIFGKPKKVVKKYESIKKPEGMARELFNLILNDVNAAETTPLFPTEPVHQGYRHPKAKLGIRKVRAWKWMGFTNPGRTDDATFYHWRRATEEGQDYAFAKFNKKINITSYTNEEYQQFLLSDNWTKAETDHLMELGKKFDLRFVIMRDRWDREKYQDRTVEDLKERYYEIWNKIGKARAVVENIPEPKLILFDAEHERRRKEQLRRLFDRTPEQIEEEAMLLAELRKIEIRKKDRDRKTQDLQKLITAADVTMTPTEPRKKVVKKTPGSFKVAVTPTKKSEATATPSNGDTQTIKFPDFKNITVFARSQRFKLPTALGQKKIKAIEQLITDFGLEVTPSVATDEICDAFNELRNNLLLVYELRQGLGNCDFELQSLRHQYEALVPGKTLKIPMELQNLASLASNPAPDEKKSITNESETLEMKRRRTGSEQGNILKKAKSRFS